MAKLFQTFPKIYQKLLPKKILALEMPDSKVDCENCREKKYKPHLKCCTFEPFIPNYLVGAILLESEDFEQKLRQFQDKSLLLPIGVVPKIEYQVAFNSRQPGEFGNREDWLCPYYKNNACSQWVYRGPVCAGYFCRHTTGGKHFWASFVDYMTYVEMAMAEEALVQLGFSPRQMSDCLEYLNMKTVLPPPGDLWQGYSPMELYLKTFRVVATMDQFTDQFHEAMGESGRELELALVRRAQGRKK